MSSSRPATAVLLAVLALLPAAPRALTPDAPADRTLSPYFVVEGGEPGVDALPLVEDEPSG